MKRLLTLAVVLASLGCRGGKLPVVTIPDGCAAWRLAIDITNPGPARDEAEALWRARYPQGCPAEKPPADPNPPQDPPSNPPATDPTSPSTPPGTQPPAGPDYVLAGKPAEGSGRDGQPTLREKVLDAIEAVTGERGGTVLLGDVTQQRFQAQVIATLREGKTWAGQHEPGVTDQISVAAARCDWTQQYDVFSGPDNECPPQPGDPFPLCPPPPGQGRRTVNWAKYLGEYPPVGCGSGEPGVPNPPASPESCPAPRWETYVDPTSEGSCGFTWGLVPKCWRLPEGGQECGLDATLNVRKCCGFCAAIGLGVMPDGVTIRCNCPLRNEDKPAERIACEHEVGAVWQARGGRLILNPANPAQAACDGAGCELRVCTKSAACSGWVKP
jgi:hypothetical protein